MRFMQQIIALGGGGFSMEPDNLLLDQYILAQTGKQHPRICFVPTASGDALEYVVKFYATFTTLDCQPSHLMLLNPTTNDLESFIMSKDAIYVGGGNTKNMLALWREWDMPRIFRQAWQSGILLCGISAGANCWFEQCITDSIPGLYTPLDCMGFIPGSCSPHYDGEPGRRPVYHQLIREGKIAPGYGVQDGAALHFIDGSLARVVSSRPTAKAFYLHLTGSEIVETQLPARYLGQG